MRRLFVLLLISLSACALPVPQDLPRNCQAVTEKAHLLSGHWRHQSGAWRFRQSALLEIGPKKIALEGFLRIDPDAGIVRLLAMNNVGVVLFDLVANEQTETLNRIVPSLQNVRGLAQGVAGSLRRIYLLPVPQKNDDLLAHGHQQRLWRWLPGGSLGYIYDCYGKLRKVRQISDAGNWQVTYDNYRDFSHASWPEKLVYQDFLHNTKLSIWVHEIKKEQ